MLNNKIGNVKVATSQRGNSYFDFSHDVNTTCGFAETQAVAFQPMMPGSKVDIDIKSLIRVAPMLVPTFGRLKYKTWANFVGFSDLSENFSAFLAQRPVARGSKSFVPSAIPSLPIRYLTAMCLCGSFCTVYANNKVPYDDFIASLKQGNTGTGDKTSPYFDFESWVVDPVKFKPEDWASSYDSIKSFSGDIFQAFSYGEPQAEYNPFDLPSATTNLTINFLLNGHRNGSMYQYGNFALPLSNPTLGSLFQFEPSKYSEMGKYSSVSISGADFVQVIPSLSYDSSTANPVARPLLLAFRLSDFGKRLRKILISCGYQLSLIDKTSVSLYPLFAYYKSYFDLFGLTLYQNWESTNASKMLTWFDYENVFANPSNSVQNPDGPQTVLEDMFVLGPDTLNDTAYTSLFLTLWKFFIDLGNTFATTSQDYISAHIESTAIGALPNLSGEFLDVTTSVPAVADGNLATAGGASNNGHGFIQNLKHGELDSEYLKKLYKWTNRNTIAGQRIAEVLKNEGLGYYIDECKSSFVGYSELELDILDVTSTSDTFDSANDSGSVLGQYAGLAVKKGGMKHIHYEASENGYLIVMASCIPDAGYCQSVPAYLQSITKNDFYQPEFDGLGFEATPMNRLIGSLNCSIKGYDDQYASKTFGFVPRYSGLKVCQNILNGNFTLRSVRSDYIPYSLDKLIDVGELSTINVVGNTASVDTAFKETLSLDFPTDAIPTCSPIWRFISRYPWLDNYARIFFSRGDQGVLPQSWYSASTKWRTQSSIFDLMSLRDDDFICHNYVAVKYYAPMLPISESFETLQEGNDGKANSSISKA